MKRRDFFKLGSMLAATGCLSRGISATRNKSDDLKRLRQAVNFIWDGEFLTPLEYSHLLMKLADEGKIIPDYYSNGGVVEALENKFAQWLGKERAVFMPTGTLANHIALRKLAGGKRRVLVQAESHIYNDSGDCTQTLSNLHLIPLGKGSVQFSLEDVAPMELKRLNEAQSDIHDNISILPRSLDELSSTPSIQKLGDWLAESHDLDLLS